MTHDHHDEGRRRFMTGLGALGLGAAAGGLGVIAAGGTAGAAQEVPQGAWPFKPLDPMKARKLGHWGYYQSSCSFGVFNAIVTCLRDEVGFPYTQIPTRMLAYGEGGVSGWCTLCGALNGACAAINLCSENEKELCDELLKWFTQHSFPSKISNDLAVNHQFLVDKYKSDKALPQSGTGSPLCHVLVTRWCKEHGYASGSSERSERCARISADVAAYTAELLNKAHADTLAKLGYSATTDQCRACHKKGKDFDKGQWTRGKMDCGGCHIDGQIKVVGKDHYPPG